jgi:hypothetical protein
MWKTLAVPARRGIDRAELQRGRALFERARCDACHTPTMRTANSRIRVLANQVIHPFTDLLLHDMGDDLADGRPDFEATGSAPISWRFSAHGEGVHMCRNIKTLHNFKPPATEDEILASSLQFVRKLSGFSKPSKANEAAFALAVHQVTEAARQLLDSLVTTAPPRDRALEAAKAHAKAAVRFRTAGS